MPSSSLLTLPGDRDHITAEMLRIRLYERTELSSGSQCPYLSEFNGACSIFAGVVVDQNAKVVVSAHCRMSKNQRVSSERRRRRQTAAWVVVAGLVGGAVGAYLALTLATANLGNLGSWLRDFAKSPGAAATAAVIAAGVALTGIILNRRAASESLSLQETTAAADSWWVMFEWASERAVPSRSGDNALPGSVTVATLARLADTATAEVQQAACAGMIDMLAARVEPGVPAESAQSVDSETNAASAEVANESALAALDSYVQANRGTKAASSVAEAVIYENSVTKTLIALSWTHDRLRIFRNPPDAGPADVIVEIGDQRVAVIIKRLSSPSAYANWFRNLGARSPGALPRVVVTPHPFLNRLGDESAESIAVVQWNDRNDDPALLQALYNAAN